MPIITYEPFSIVSVPFPFSDKFQTKRRPALVLSEENHQADTGTITLAMITTAKNSTWQSDYTIQDIKKTGLMTPSIIRQKIFTIDSDLIFQKIGKLSLHDETEVKKKIKKHFAF